MPVEQALQSASQQIDAGHLQAAEAILRQILDKSPTHAEALRLMGILAHQAGNSELAGELIGTAFVTFAEGVWLWLTRPIRGRRLARILAVLRQPSFQAQYFSCRGVKSSDDGSMARCAPCVSVVTVNAGSCFRCHFVL